MLKEQKVRIEVNRGNLPYYSKIVSGISIGDCIDLEIDQIPNGSNIAITATCDICGNDVRIAYGLYTKRNNHKGSFACSKKCAAVRTKKELMEKHGVSNIAQVPIVKKKIKGTMLERYGSETYMASDDALNKRTETMLERYGVDNPLKSDFIKERAKKTNIERYGVEWTLASDSIRERIKSTNIERYGEETPSKNDLVRNKMISTNEEKWGGRSPMCNPEVKEKSRNTLMENYGVDSPLRSEDVKDRLKNTNLERLGVEYPSQSREVMDKIIKSGKETKIRNGTMIADEDLSDWFLYRKNVKNLTNQAKSRLFEEWDGHDYYDGEYIKDNLHKKMYNDYEYPTIDHKISVIYGFNNDMSPEEIGSIENLCITKKGINSSKSFLIEEDYINKKSQS
jgi:arsenate reductase-like glutaredoxin family protein